MSDESAAPAAPSIEQALQAALPKGPEAAPAQKEPQKDERFAAKFAALTRKEKEIRQREQQYGSEASKLKAEREELQKWRAEKEANESGFKKSMKENPLKFLEEQGFTFEDIMKMQLNEQNPTPEMLIKRTRDELETGYRKELEDLKKSMADKEEATKQAQYEQTVSGFKKEISDFVDGNEEAYELIKLNDAKELVFDVIQEFYQSTGRVLSVEEATKHTEEHLESEARKVFEAKRFKQPAKEKQEPGEKKAAPTLSNTQSSEVPSIGDVKLSREESLKDAAKLIRWIE